MTLTNWNPRLLFDLANDPAEDNDLAGKPEVAERLDDMGNALRNICDLQQTGARAKSNQAKR